MITVSKKENRNPQVTSLKKKRLLKLRNFKNRSERRESLRRRDWLKSKREAESQVLKLWLKSRGSLMNNNKS